MSAFFIVVIAILSILLLLVWPRWRKAACLPQVFALEDGFRDEPDCGGDFSRSFFDSAPGSGGYNFSSDSGSGVDRSDGSSDSRSGNDGEAVAAAGIK